MKSRATLVAAAVATTLLLSPGVFASPVNIHAPLNAMFAKQHKASSVQLSLQNDFDNSVKLQVGDNVVTLAAGKSLALNLPVGTRIVTNSDTSTMHAGTLVAQVSDALSGATIHIK